MVALVGVAHRFFKPESIKLFLLKTLANMEAVTQSTTEQILNHHLAAFIDANVDEIMKDYTEQSELLTPDGPVLGLKAIRDFFQRAFNILPKGSSLDLKQTIIRGNMVYLAWTGESSFVNIPLGTDTFIFENDKILFQTLAAQIVTKQ